MAATAPADTHDSDTGCNIALKGLKMLSDPQRNLVNLHPKNAGKLPQRQRLQQRRPDPVLQQLEPPWSGDVSVKDTLRAVSCYSDRISRPEQVLAVAPQAMRVLVNQAETGAVMLAFPQDVRVEAKESLLVAVGPS